MDRHTPRAAALRVGILRPPEHRKPRVMPMSASMRSDPTPATLWHPRGKGVEGEGRRLEPQELPHGRPTLLPVRGWKGEGAGLRWRGVRG